MTNIFIKIYLNVLIIDLESYIVEVICYVQGTR